VTRRPVLPARVTARAARAGARWAVLAVLADVTLAHALPVTPGGIGITQVGAALPLTASYGVAPEDAVAFAVALALSETGPGVLLGALCAVREGAVTRGPPPEATRARSRGPSFHDQPS
jgi:hypothetical protein